MDIHGGDREIPVGSAGVFAGNLKMVALSIEKVEDPLNRNTLIILPSH